LTEGIVYEFLRVATHPKVFASPLLAADVFRCRFARVALRARPVGG